MSRNHRRLAPSPLALLIAAGAVLAGPAQAANTTITVPEGGFQFGAIVASPAAGDTVTINNFGTAGFFGAGLIVQGSGAGGVIINNDERISGRFDFTGATGPVTLHNNTGDWSGVGFGTLGWNPAGVNVFGAGADLVDNALAGVIATEIGSTSFDFGAGADTFANTGRFIVGNALGASTVTLTGLETFQNTGSILLGSPFVTTDSTGLRSDGVTDDRLMALGVAFNGSGASRIAMDVNLSGVTQADCSALTAADCVDFTGGSTAGSTVLTISASGFSSVAGLSNGITLIVGSSAAENFSLDPASDGYTEQSSFGAVVQKKLVAYRLVYDAAGHRHRLFGILADDAVQSATFAGLGQETWRSTAGNWFTRQADLRATPGGLEPSSGLWARAGAGVSERELAISVVQGGTTYAYNVDHKQQTAQVVIGADLMGAVTQDAAWVLGGMLGLVRSDVEYDATPTEIINRGFTGGLYASYVSGPLFIDAAVNANQLTMNTEVPNMTLGAGVNLKQGVRSVGGQLEAGWRLQAGEAVFVEPLASVSYVETQIDDIDIPGGSGGFEFEESYTSFRAGAGLRVGMDASLLGQSASWGLTGRYWNEFEAQNGSTVRITSGATSTPIADDFGGGFGELAASLNLYSADGAVSSFANLGGRFGDGYRSVDGSVGVRLRW